jgi:hypothetical protein
MKRIFISLIALAAVIYGIMALDGEDDHFESQKNAVKNAESKNVASEHAEPKSENSTLEFEYSENSQIDQPSNEVITLTPEEIEKNKESLTSTMLAVDQDIEAGNVLEYDERLPDEIKDSFKLHALREVKKELETKEKSKD